MRRSVRPKSAKGKPRPTPPNHSRPSAGVPAPSTSSTSYSPDVTAINADQPDGRATQKQDSNPSHFPEVKRPVSSLSRYNILPQISATPTERGNKTSPAGSELELDLMSSFAQQMILDSTRMNHSRKKTVERKHPVPPKEPSSFATRRQNKFQSQDSPAHKRSRTTATRSVFTHQARSNPAKDASNNRRKAEPKDGEPRLKIAIKLPDGNRLERYFSPNSSINDVMTYAQTRMRIPLKDCEVYSMLQVPKVLIKNWKRTLEQLELRDRTMLYIEEKD